MRKDMLLIENAKAFMAASVGLLAPKTKVERELHQARKAHFHNMLAAMARQEAYWKLHGDKPW